MPIGKLYASDLVGASLGCLFVLGAFELFDAPSIILLSGGVAATAAVCFALQGNSKQLIRVSIATAVVLLLIGFLNSTSPRGIRPLIVKARAIEPAEQYYKEAWNSFSRVAVYPMQIAPPQLWGPSPKLPAQLCEQYLMNIDGEARTVVGKFKYLDDIDYLRYDLTNVAYRLIDGGPACIIGIGGGRDLQSAVLFGCMPITGVELNPIFVRLLKNDFADFAGLANRAGVQMVTAEARSYLTHTDKKFSIIQMSLIDTWAATGAGAFSLSENTLYTVEAWKTFLDRLEDHGFYTVSRWRSSVDVSEIDRTVSLAVAALFQIGAQRPADHLALVSTGDISTIILGRSPLTQDDIHKIRDTCKEMDFEINYLPDMIPERPLLKALVFAKSRDELDAVADQAELNCSPPTDENPYFFNMLRLRNVGTAFRASVGVIHGNLLATLTLVTLMVMLGIVAVATIILPLLLKRRFGCATSTSSSVLWSARFISA